MESNSEVGRITVSDVAASLLRLQAPLAVLLPRGEVPIKGKGLLTLWWLAAAPPLDSQPWRVRIGSTSRLLDEVLGEGSPSREPRSSTLASPGGGPAARRRTSLDGGASPARSSPARRSTTGAGASPPRRPRVSIQAWRDNDDDEEAAAAAALQQPLVHLEVDEEGITPPGAGGGAGGDRGGGIAVGRATRGSVVIAQVAAGAP